MTIEILNSIYGRVISSSIDTTTFVWLIQAGIIYEDELIRKIRTLLSETKRGIIIDGGANIGCWSLAMAPLAESVIAIEPQRQVYNMLCGSIALNNLSNHILPLHAALGSTNSQAHIPRVDLDTCDNLGGAALVEANIPTSQTGDIIESVDVYPIDGLVATDEYVSFIKLDVEGSEYDALVGAQETIERCRPILFVEWFLNDELKLGQLVTSMGYAVSKLEWGNWLALPIS